MTELVYQPRVAPSSLHYDVRGIDYHVSEWGNGDDPLLVMLHGWGDTGSSFQFVVDEFLKDWHVIAPDWRGFGDSGHGSPAYWFPDYLADLDVLLQQVSADSPVHLIGHSMGANVAGLYAGIMPERVSSFINIEGFGLAESDADDAPDNYRRWIEQSRVKPAFMNYNSFEDLAARIMRRAPRMSDDKAMYVAHHWARVGEDGLVRIKADPTHKLPNAIQYRRAEAAACWERVRAPVLLVAGAETEFTAAKVWLDSGACALPFSNGHSVRIPDAGHMVHFEQPRALATAIEDFILAVL